MTNTALQIKFPENELPSVGQILKEGRLSKGLTLEEVAKILCINKRRLAHLEEDQENLVCDVYTLGFLKSYIQYLGLDGKDLSQKFRSQAIHPSPSHLPFPAPLPGKGMPSRRILGFSFLALLVVIGGWKWFEYSDSGIYLLKSTTEEIKTLPVPNAKAKESLSSQNTSPLPESLLKVSLPAERVESLVNSASVLQTPIPSQSVLLKATKEVWIEVKDKEGKIIFTRLFRPGESYEFKDPQHLVLKTGNAGGVSLISGEKSIASLGKTGEVKNGIFLDPEKWVEQSPETH